MAWKILIFVFIFSNSFGSVLEKSSEEGDNPLGIFSGRVVKVNDLAGLTRIKIDFVNMKYLNKFDKIDLWDPQNPGTRCKSYIVGKTNQYLLIKVPDFKFCKKYVYLNTGSYLNFFSQDLINNLTMGKELVSILLKKHLALRGMMQENKKQLDAHIEKVHAVNSRYQILRDKLEAEWRDELAHLEDDRIKYYKRFKEYENQVNEINHQLEKYRIEDQNLEVDRWALDSRLFFKK